MINSASGARALMRVALVVLLLSARANADEPGRIEATLVDADAISGGTFQSNNQKVVQNRRGIFMTHTRTWNEADTTHQGRVFGFGSIGRRSQG